MAAGGSDKSTGDPLRDVIIAQGKEKSALDELHERRELSDEVWAELRRHLDEPLLIELCMLIGHYEMLAMTINSLGIEPDTPRRV